MKYILVYIKDVYMHIHYILIFFMIVFFLILKEEKKFLNKMIDCFLKCRYQPDLKKFFLKEWMFASIKTFCPETSNARNLKEVCRACSFFSFRGFVEKSVLSFPNLKKFISCKEMEKIFKTQRREKFRLSYYIQFPQIITKMYAKLRHKKKIPSFFSACIFFPIWVNSLCEEAEQKEKDNDIIFYENKKSIFLLNNMQKNKILLKTPIPRELGRQGWGEYWLAQDINEALSSNFNAAVFNEGKYPLWSDFDTFFDGAIYMRGRESFMPFNKEKSIMWLFCHPADVSLSEMNLYKTVACASENYAELLKNSGIRCEYVPQCTKPQRFYADKDSRYEMDIIFVGNTRGIFRDAVKFSLEKSIDIKLFGRGWGCFVPGKNIIADYVDNNMLRKYYSNSKIILNDHWEDMKCHGFVSNRIFDVTACGGFLISDYMDEIKKIYGESIPMYKNSDELSELVRYYLDNEEERFKKAREAQEITLSRFTTLCVSKKLNELLFN